MYQRLTKRQEEARARRLEAMRRGKDRARMAREPRGRPPELPDLRREVTVIDFDSGQPVAHTLRMFKTRRIDVSSIGGYAAHIRRASGFVLLTRYKSTTCDTFAEITRACRRYMNQRLGAAK